MSVDRRVLVKGVFGCGCCAAMPIWPVAVTAQPVPPAQPAGRIPPAVKQASERAAMRTGGCLTVQEAGKPRSNPIAVSKLKGTERRFALAANSAAAAVSETSKGDNPAVISLAGAIARLQTTFGVKPPFEFFDEGVDDNGRPLENAQAFFVTEELPNSKVSFGLNLFTRLMRDDPSGAAVLAVLAHEYAHVGLFLRPEVFVKFSKFPTVLRPEIHADYLSGYYLGLRKREVPSVSLFRAGAAIWGTGDTHFTHPGHHGTPVDRSRAAEAGFQLGHRVAPNFNQAFDYATNFVLVSYEHDPR